MQNQEYVSVLGTSVTAYGCDVVIREIEFEQHDLFNYGIGEQLLQVQIGAHVTFSDDKFDHYKLRYTLCELVDRIIRARAMAPYHLCYVKPSCWNIEEPDVYRCKNRLAIYDLSIWAQPLEFETGQFWKPSVIRAAQVAANPGLFQD